MNRLFSALFLVSSLKYGSAAICWSQMKEVNGQDRCQGLIRTGISREECCNSGPRSYLNSYTANEVDSGTLFRWIALEGGCPYCIQCRESCDGVDCGAGKLCKLNKKGRPRCVCDLDCSSDLQEGEVCGTDEKTYSSECHLQKARCRKEQSIEVGYYGSCKESCEGVVCPSGKKCIEDSDGDPHCIACGISCPKPKPKDALVCGSDGMTYESKCQLDTQKCLSNPDLALAHKGKCDATQPLRCEDLQCAMSRTCLINQDTGDARCEFCSCSDDWTLVGHVCGSDNTTYSNMCELRDQACRTGKVITMVSYGPCPRSQLSSSHEETENSYNGIVEYEYSGDGQEGIMSRSSNSTSTETPTLDHPLATQDSNHNEDEFGDYAHAQAENANIIRHSRGHIGEQNKKMEDDVDVTRTYDPELIEKPPSEKIVWKK